MKLHVVIDNVYPDDGTITNEYDLEALAPTLEDVADEFQEWAYDAIFPYTGTGRPNGEAGYFAVITSCDNEQLVGLKFEWGT